MAKEDKVEPRYPDNIPVVEPKPGTVHPELEDYEGEYTRASDGEVYALAVVENDPLGRTHKALNTAHFWEGTERDFLVEFTEVGKEGSDKKIPSLNPSFEEREKARKEEDKSHSHSHSHSHSKSHSKSHK